MTSEVKKEELVIMKRCVREGTGKPKVLRELWALLIELKGSWDKAYKEAWKDLTGVEWKITVRWGINGRQTSKGSAVVGLTLLLIICLQRKIDWVELEKAMRLRESLLWGVYFWISTHKNFFKELVERDRLKIWRATLNTLECLECYFLRQCSIIVHFPF